MRNKIVWGIFLLSVRIYSESVDLIEKFPIYPAVFSDISAQNYAMGNTYVFTHGPLAVFYNPANLDTFSSVIFGLGYEFRKSEPSTDWKEQNTLYFPQSVGFGIPFKKKSLGILFANPYLWKRVYSEEISSGYLNDFSIAYAQNVFSSFNIGIGINYVWGKESFDKEEGISGYVNGVGGQIGILYFLKPNFSFTTVVKTPTFLQGKETWNTDNTSYTIKDSLPWEIGIGSKQVINNNLQIYSQFIHREWREMGGIGSKDEILGWGSELKINKYSFLRIGSYLRQLDVFYPHFPFTGTPNLRIFCVTGGIAFQKGLYKTEFGFGKDFILENHLVRQEWASEYTAILNITVSLPHRK